jgi:hypothetical protein
MSSKRRQRGNVTEDLLGDLTSNEVENGTSDLPAFGGKSAADIADFGYRTAVGHDDRLAQMTNREKIVFKPIELIHQNRSQPRRALPSKVRPYFMDSDAESMAHGFQLWLEEVKVERKSPFPLDELLAGKETSRVEGIETVDTDLEQTGSSPKMGAMETALMQVVELAASIKRDGLINPISIARIGSDDKNNLHYEIETGERRWLAYHLLNWQYPDSGWDKIPTRQVEGGVSIWRQANENNIRADLNAIAMARQFALLLMDILRDEKEFLPFDAFVEHEQDFYAQVADGGEYRVPRNQGEKLLNAMNLENPVQLRQYRALLRLPREVWQWADDLNWTEGFIRMEIFGKGDTPEDLVRLAYKQAKAEGYTVTADTVYEDLLKSPQSKEKSTKPRYTYKHFSKTLGEKVHTYLVKLSGKERENTIAYLREMLESLESQ